MDIHILCTYANDSKPKPQIQTLLNFGGIASPYPDSVANFASGFYYRELSSGAEQPEL